ncbi:helix-turn-helix domain-containing protein [Dactylosporangium sp. NPDC051485]|uniref:helix-turn-helix domain-containing protein n=1 Tax=Dactylosporangium sp. NPDC051485 TaxID=3154846 RepID=UPI003430620D
MTTDTATSRPQPAPAARERGWWRSDEVSADIAARYRDGRSVRGIAVDLHCGYGTVHQALVLAQVTMRPRGGSRKRPGAEPDHRAGGRFDHRVRAGIWAAVETAEDHLAQNRPDPAGQLLADALSPFDPETVRPEECLVEAAIVYAATADGSDVDAVLPWARYAYRNSRRVFPTGHLRIAIAVETYANALDVAGDRAAAILIEREHIALLPADRSSTDLHRLHLARTLHDAGQCQQALHEAAALLEVITERQPILDGDAAALLRSVAAIQHGCHQHDLAAHTAAPTTPENVRGDLRSIPGYAHLAAAWQQEPVEHAATWHPGQVCDHPACPAARSAPGSAGQLTPSAPGAAASLPQDGCRT